ncbi:MAG: hypothetical protein PUD59_04950 [bacterium]|nr:hypothetical protein [bacterium]
MKIKAWGIKQGVWGGEPQYYYFSSKEARDEYFNSHDYFDKLRCKKVDAEYVYDSVEALKAAERW